MKDTTSLLEKNFTNSLAPTKIKWFRRQLSIWAKQNLRNFPWRQTCDPYAILVAEFLLQRTEAATVVPIYTSFLARYPTLQDLAAANVEEIGKLLQPLGLFFRAERLHQCAQILLQEYRGKIPESEKQLLKLPGIGKYTARSICANAFGQSLAILDTNVARILERFFGMRGGRVKSRCKLLWQTAERIAPHKEVGKWNLTLLDFGAQVCTAKNPLCSECLLRKRCDYATLYYVDSEKYINTQKAHITSLLS
ncbi:A/G-specific adenine glycosylase [Pleurocapsales cyanobacterium LEGE 06147]|nr:A/G-specific adenine glycosylase [Pleurocapsales cyanobacterium LEGE 06147]